MQNPDPPLKDSKRQIVDKKSFWLAAFGKALRLTCLSILFAGSAAIVFAAVTLVKIGEAKGLSVGAAAAANAPIFLRFSKIVAAAAVALLLSEAIDGFLSGKTTLSKMVQYIATTACCLCGFYFAFIVAPDMERLLPDLRTNIEAAKAFHSLHEISRLVFSGIIIFAWASLLTPVFSEKKD